MNNDIKLFNIISSLSSYRQERLLLFLEEDIPFNEAIDMMYRGLSDDEKESLDTIAKYFSKGTKKSINERINQ